MKMGIKQHMKVYQICIAVHKCFLHIHKGFLFLVVDGRVRQGLKILQGSPGARYSPTGALGPNLKFTRGSST